MIRSSAAPVMASASVGSTTFLSPVRTPGITSFDYALPARKGRLIIKLLGNGNPGGSGAVGPVSPDEKKSYFTVGGSGGSRGQYREFDYDISDLIELFPTLTKLNIDFGTLGTPGPSVTTNNTPGVPGPASSSVNVRINSNTGALIGAAFTEGADTAPGGLLWIDGVYTTASDPAVKMSTGGRGGDGGNLDAGNREAEGAPSIPDFDSLFSDTNPGGAKVAGVAGAGDGKTATSVYLKKSILPGVGGSGGGSSASTTVPGGKGGDGAGFGAPGGGGGAGRNGAGSGAGGKATYGVVQIDFIAA